jgi:chaperone required for assembly of F1-ATPase
MSDDFSPGDPMRAAQKNMRPVVLKRFYASATVAKIEEGFALQLDGRGARTPAKNRLLFPTQAAAELAAQEWAEQGEAIDPAAMPVTRIANSAIDGVATAMRETRAELAAYAETDLVYYRAAAPEKLVEAREAFDEPFALAALHVMTTLTGSILLALGVFRGRFSAADAWRIAHVDEDFQIGQWGEDDEAMARRAARWREMEAAAKVAAALG